jgi:surface protein
MLHLLIYFLIQTVGQDIYISDEESFVNCTEAVFCTDEARPNIFEAIGNGTNTNCGVVGIIGYCSSPAPSLSPSSWPSLLPSLRPLSRPSSRPSMSSRPSAMPSVVPGQQAFITRMELDEVIVSYLTLQIRARRNVTARNELNTIISQYGRMKNWDVSQINDMGYLFLSYTSFNEDISRWNVSQVTSMRYMFYQAEKFNQNLSLWDVSKVMDMVGMFQYCYDFQGIGLERWSTNQVQDMYVMFYGARSFNRNLSQWDTSQVMNMAGMFTDASSFRGFGLENWNTSQVVDMDGMFAYTTVFNGNIAHWDVSKVTDMNAMFRGALAFLGVNDNNIDSIGLWNVSLVEYFNYTFANAELFRANLTAWNTASVMRSNNMFDGATSFPGVYWYE